ncbi:L-threonylcarbamoyladenylate synthase [Fulvivirga lutea]|uniref:Threonylcarbamoyl-AMP synthase n=1 Tax=Fulvivirga lutea TaxID=2810512 RepID=A0A974ZZD2_9BACT|nr:L-threonylcarbamoyladenylate synthase [Fulvivirga lutea]QSE95961.1 threonylcarbamoyl-AMP synthase [Fulvivirga lutea]
MAEIGTDLLKAKQLLSEGKLVAIPTETVYGLAGNAFNPDAVASIFSVKKRPSFDPLIVHVAGYGQALSLTKNVPEVAESLAAKFWPGPLTLLLKRKPIIPDLVTSGLETVGIRLPNQSLTRKLISSLDFPLVAPSANPFGYISPTSPQHVNDQLGDKIDYILDGGECHVGIESTIVGFENGKVSVHRLGGISVEEIEKVAGNVTIELNSSSNPKAPGMLANHYSPTTAIVIGNIDQLLKEHSGKAVGILSYTKEYENPFSKTLAPDGEIKTAAKNLFAHLRWLDRQPLDIIITETVPNNGLGMAINDRLKRAAAKKN